MMALVHPQPWKMEAIKIKNDSITMLRVRPQKGQNVLR